MKKIMILNIIQIYNVMIILISIENILIRTSVFVMHFTIKK